MATIKTITIEYGYTVGLSNYSSARAGVALTAELAEGEDTEEVVTALQEEARKVVHYEIDQALVRDGKAPRFGQPEDPKDSEVPF